MAALTELRIQNFKSWADTGAMRLAPITGLFGTNSSGKSSILQFLLMLKQTVEVTDRSQVLNFGDSRSYVELGTFYDVIHQRLSNSALGFNVQKDNGLRLEASIQENPGKQVVVDTIRFSQADDFYQLHRVNVNTRVFYGDDNDGGFDDTLESTYEVKYALGGKTSEHIEAPEQIFISKFYDIEIDDLGLQLVGESQEEEKNWLQECANSLEKLFRNVYYIGPLRSHPARIYVWGGMAPADVGRYGENAVQALISSLLKSEVALERVAHWLKQMGLIEEFTIVPIAENRREYELRIKKNIQGPYVSLADVGFGVSQVLPILTLCYYMPSDSILILEQPELHLHPSAQSILADVFIEVATKRNIQIILESHSEHLLRRLQRRIAEQQISAKDTALYFCEIENGISELTALQVDPFGSITNWPKDFFGDDMGDIAAMTIAAMERQQS